MFEFLPQWLRNCIIAALLVVSVIMTIGAFREGMASDGNIVNGLSFFWGLTLVALAGDNIKRDTPWTIGKILLTIIGAIGSIVLILSFT